MNHDTEMNWLLEQRPDPAAPSRSSTETARAALLAHGAKRRRDRQRSGGLAIALAITIALTIAGLIGRPGHAAPRRAPVNLSIAPKTTIDDSAGGMHRSAPLVRLAADVRRLEARRQPGNATLVVRYTTLSGHHRIDAAAYGGYDLYTDSGRYYWAPNSLQQLRRVVKQGPSHGEPGNEARALRRIAAAAAGSPAQARAAVLGHVAAPLSSRAQKHAPGPPQIIDVRARDDSIVWLNATEGLAAGAGSPSVRAACIKALDTLNGVHESSDRIGPIRALRVGYPDGHQQVVIWLNARTGVPIQERDGHDSTTIYSVERVTAAHLPSHMTIQSHLR
jgi:hypothetical protein